MRDGIARHLAKEQAEILTNNFMGIIRDPITVAAVAAMVHIRDKFSWGILPGSCWQEIMGATAAQVACAVCGRYDQMAEYLDQLGKVSGNANNNDFLYLCWQAIALGFSNKWSALPENTDAEEDRP